MALCSNCSDARNEYVGNGVQKEYSITFEYYTRDDVAVAFWNEETLLWEPVGDDDWDFQHETLIRFDDAPAYDQKFIIYRCTDLEPLPAQFNPGFSIKAQDLNDNFFVIARSIEEVRCAINRNDEKSEEKYWDKVADTITKEQQVNGEADALLDDEHIFDAEAIAARSDAYVQGDKPPELVYEQPGKQWFDTDDLKGFFWDPDIGAWVGYGTSGPAGPPGDFGPPGKVVVSDYPPTEYPATNGYQARPLESGDLWWDSYRGILYVYYLDNYGPGQWVSVTMPGPQGKQGEQGNPGNDGANGNDGTDGIDGAPGADGNDGAPGADGVTPQFSVGTVETSDPGANAEVTQTGTDVAPVLNFVLPRGDEGPEGPAGGNFPDAPTDGKIYGRKDNGWEEVTAAGGGGDTNLTAVAPLKIVNNEISIDLLTIPNAP